MNELAIVTKKFPEYEFAMRRLPASDDESKIDCEDYALAICALDRWNADRGPRNIIEG